MGRYGKSAGLLAFYQLIHETSQVHQLRGSGDQGWVPFNDEPLQQGARNTQKALQRLSHLHIELWEKKQLCVLHLSRFCIPDQGHDMLELQFAHIWGGVKPPSRNQLMSFRFLLGFITLCHLPPGQRTFFWCRSGSVLGRMAKCNCKEPYPPVSPRWSRRWSGGDRWIPPWVLLAAASWLNPMKYSYVPHKHLETIVIGDDLPTKDRVFPDAAWFVGTKGIQAATVNPPAGRRVPRACQRTAHRSPATAQLWRQAGRAGWWKVGEWLVNIGSFDPSWGGRVRKREIPVTFCVLLSSGWPRDMEQGARELSHHEGVACFWHRFQNANILYCNHLAYQGWPPATDRVSENQSHTWESYTLVTCGCVMRNMWGQISLLASCCFSHLHLYLLCLLQHSRRATDSFM